MAKIYKVNQLPYDDLVTDESAIYYNYNTREIILKTTRGVEKFQAMVPPKSFDAFSVNGYFPLYFSAAEAELHSPVYESISYGEEELGPPPPNVTYPVFMPLGLTEFYDGDYVDPIEDDNDNGVLNFRDPQEVGIVALPVLDYARQDPFTTPTGTILSVNDYISKADVGTYNDTDEPVAVCTPFPGVIFDGAGEVSYVDGPGAGVIPSGGVLFKDVHQASTVLTEPSVAYTADPFVSFGGVSVNISEYLPNGFSSILENTTGSSYSIYVIKSGIIVSSVGEVTYFLPGQLTLNHGDTVFYSQSSSSSLEPTETIYVEDNFVYDSCDIELKEYFDKDPIDGGSYNHMTSDVLVITHTDGVIINPATCSVTSTQPGTVTLPPGNFLITKISKVLLRFIACTAGSAISVQWFEEDADGALVLRTEAFDSSNPAIQYWEFEGDYLVPREFAYSSTTESAQYFELDDSGNVIPVEGDGSTTGSGSSGGGSSGGGTGGGTTDISYNVSLNQSIVFGSISNVSPTAALVGETVSFDVSAETNFQIDTVTATQDSNSNQVSLTNNGGGNYSFSMPADNVTLNATFVAQDTDGDGISDLDDPNINDYNYTVSIDSSTNGALSVDNSTPIFGTTITITAVPASGYETSTITVTEDGGASVSVSGTGDSRTFTMPATNVTVSGTFTASAPSSYTVSVDSGLSNGSLSADQSSATEGSTVTITASPDSGYETSTITVTEDGGASVSVSGTGDSRTFIMPATNVTVSGTFSLISYSVSVDSGLSNGSLSADQSSATEGSTITITASPDSGYETSTITVTEDGGASVSVSGTGDSRTFTMPATNVTVSGTFTAPASPLSGTLSGNIVSFSFTAEESHWSMYGAVGDTINGPDSANAVSRYSIIAYQDSSPAPLIRGGGGSSSDGFYIVWQEGAGAKSFSPMSDASDTTVPGTLSNYGETISGSFDVSTAQWYSATGGIVTGIDTTQDFSMRLLHFYSTNSGSYYVREHATFSFAGVAPTSYSVSVDSGLSNGSLSVDQSSATEGSNITITASPDSGYQTSTITVTEDGGDAVPVSGTGFTDVAGDENAKFYWDHNSDTLFIEFTQIAPNQNYVLKNNLVWTSSDPTYNGLGVLAGANVINWHDLWKGDGSLGEPTISSTNSGTTYTMAFKMSDYYDDHGDMVFTLVNNNDNSNIAFNGETHPSISPDSSESSHDGWVPYSNTRTFSMPADNVTVSGTFTASAPSSYTVSVDPGLSNGSLSVDQSSATEGSTITITASPDSGYETSTITVTEDGGTTVSVSGTGDSRTFIMPSANVTVSASFSTLNCYGIYYGSGTTNKTGGSFSVSPPGTQYEPACEGETITITTNPNYGYTVSQVTALDDWDNTSLTVTNTGNNTYTFVMPNFSATVDVFFT